MRNNSKYILPILIIVIAIMVSFSAGYYSVTGIGEMFAGKKYNVMFMMACLEIAKVVLVSFLEHRWSFFPKILKFYYITAVFILMCITSAGIYGYLSSAYSNTAIKLEGINKEVSIIDVKKNMYIDKITDIRKEKDNINININELTKGLSNNVQQRVDNKGNVITTSSSQNRVAFENQLKNSKDRISELGKLEIIYQDSISKLEMNKLNLELNNEVAGEVASLKYISNITNKPMDVVVNWFILAIMLVFDPLAISLIIGANITFRKLKEEDIEEVSKINSDNNESIEIPLGGDNDENNVIIEDIHQYINEQDNTIDENSNEEEINNEPFDDKNIGIDIENTIKSLDFDKMYITNQKIDNKISDIEFNEKFSKIEDERKKLESLKREIEEWEQKNIKAKRQLPSKYKDLNMGLDDFNV